MSTEADTILIATSPAPKVEINKYENLLCGMVTGVVTRTLTSPFDVVKILLQVNSKGGNVKDTIKGLWQQDGIAAFWRGNFAGCLNQGPQSALKFFVLEELRKVFGDHLTGGKRALMGACAGLVSQSVIYPLDFVHTRILLDPVKYNGIFNSVITILKEEGITAFWSGLAPTIMGAIPFEGSQFYCYDGLCQFYKTKIGKTNEIKPVVNCVIGAISGAISQTIAYPFDVVRKRMIAGKRMGNTETTVAGTFKSIYKNEGVGGFFKGLSVNMVKIIPYAALQYTIFAEAKDAVIKYKTNKLLQQKDKKRK
ncbi:hydrogenosomal membrane protein 31 precursor [Histomonas meleagridis]|uniref:hydrogenosomal membrane protein 31 precursor n=1 Tax=Histomonas meleagridis TaxID=135588 RepID=UPI003559A068|nr:hydrogenosomal membrane protein 31 precursor [Histomonas meleagridis]KAH0802949.1 hydrogenosomal membrane protein 31 precursor [Histomonas meleagridis]